MSGRQDKLQEIMSGSLGVYWCQEDGKDIQPGHSAGYLRMTPQNLIRVETLLGDYVGPLGDFFDKKPSRVTSIVGRTANDTVYLLDSVGRRNKLTLGGPDLSVGIYTFKCATVGVPIDELNSDRVRAVSVQYPRLLQWANMSTLERKWFTDSEGRNRRAEYVLDAGEQKLNLKAGSYSITLRPHWRVAHPEGDIQLSTALDVHCEVVRPRAIGDLTDVILRIQDLLSVARQELVVAREGGMCVDLKESSGETYPMWHRDLMATKSPSIEKSDDERPFFTLDDIGGVRGLARWIKLYGEHPRLVGPVARHWRYGDRSAAAALLESAIAMEYFVKSTKKSSGARWTSGANFAVSIASRVGRPLNDWSSDAEEWGLLFWETYNAIKHNLQEHDPQHVAIMATSGRLVLTAFILSRIAGSNAVASRFLNDHRFAGFREVVRECVANSHLKDQSVRQRRRRSKTR